MTTRLRSPSIQVALGLMLTSGPQLACAVSDTSAKSPVMAVYEGRRPVGIQRMVFDEFHSLSRPTLRRSALPWKALAAALLVSQRRREPTLPMTDASFLDLLRRRYGFLVPSRVANWPTTEAQPEFRRPIGLLEGTLSQAFPPSALELTNLGCSTCHSANLYDSTGTPTREVWVGLPSGSIDLGRFGEEVFQALLYAAHHVDETMTVVKQVFPAVSATEFETLRGYYLPETGKVLDKLAAALGGFTPHSNGGPGLTNGVATLKLYLGVIDNSHKDPSQVAFTSIPDLAGLRLRSSILWDGVYAPPGWSHTGPLPAGLSRDQHQDAMAGVVALVTIGTTGVTPEVAASNIPRIRDAVTWIMEDYRPPAFPGPIDLVTAKRGANVYAQHCSYCHGDYEETSAGLRLGRFPNMIVPAELIGTDPTRAAAVGADPNALFAKTAMGAHLHAKGTGGYVAMPLTAVWATAPYLHNGSVPTLWHLMHPGARPTSFQVGGHRLSFEKVGIDGSVDRATTGDAVYRYPVGYRPWMDPETYDTRAPGRSNAGHADMFDDVSEDDKHALLEFLKRV